MTKEITPIYRKPDERRDLIRGATVEGIQRMFPIVGDHKELHLDRVYVDTKSLSNTDHKNALLRGSTLAESIKGDLVIRDKAGKVLDKQRIGIL